MNKKTVLILAIVYMTVTLILNNVLQTAIGGFMMTLSLLAFVVLVIGSAYYIIKFHIKQFNYNHKNRHDIE
ncbi:antibiotic biosynthesis monooxygenase (ABM) superfamily enzyme [Alkalicoccobacillus murimartini]|uniref:Antibiotic biosynthesis monooxygenase (ABM) superfamily enzyme n=1 Tax=Alkalicoccobacillus murimartini TaxID=171685 RepID=A0ABT9YP66_9BACI|nr:antibiotic biosynthesis monooxygenase (ABM) superfamily enzyme [Alkalicoccobacillus murimartini]